jgi:hypothetical protein
MAGVYVAWVVSALVLIASAGWVGWKTKGNILGILVDSRNRFSLSRFQIVLWTIAVLSLLAGAFVGRLLAGVANPLNVAIPTELLAAMGISVGSAASASAIKAGKDLRGQASRSGRAPYFTQVVTTEEGSYVDRTVDIAKFQNFWMTILVVVAYISTASAYVAGFSSVADLTALPGFDPSLLILLGISHAGYLAGKLPDKK